MSKRSNLGILLLVLGLDVLLGIMWYIIIFPTEPVEAIAVVGATLMAIMFTVVSGYLNWVTYQGCISDD